MLKHLSKAFKKGWVFYSILLIFVAVFASYWQVSFMYYGQDDHSLIFKLQHIPEAAGQYGRGLWDRNSMYRYMVVPFAPIYKIFGTLPFPYFFISIFNYFFAACSVFYLGFTLTRKKTIALLAALIFSVGYVGSDSMLRLTNSYQIPHTIVFMCLTAAFYKEYFDKVGFKRFLFYILAFVFYLATIEIFWIRGYGMLFIILGLELLYKFKLRKILGSVFRLIPFVYVYYIYYIAHNNSSGDLVDFKVKLFNDTYNVILTTARTLQNFFIPDNLTNKLISVYPFIPIIFVIILLYFLWKLRNKTLWYGIIIILGSMLVYVLKSPLRVIETTHRYSTISFVGAAIFWAVFIREIFKKRTPFVIAATFFVTFYLVQNNIYLARNLKERNIPTKKFYETLKKEIPNIREKTVMYFDVESDQESTRLYKEAFGVGNMPDKTAIAWQYGIDRSFLERPDTFMEILDFLKKGKVNLNDVYTLYYSADRGLINTTQTTRQALSSWNKTNIYLNSGKIDFIFSSPIEVKLNIITKINNTLSNKSVKKINLPLYLSYLQSKNDYYRTIKAVASSDWENERDINLVDNDINTLWMGDRLYWRDSCSETIIVDMQTNRSVGAVLLTYFSRVRAPKKYEYFCSLDKLSWGSLGKFTFSAIDTHQIIYDKIGPANCRYVKLQIVGSQIDDSPELAEIEIIDNAFRNIDPLFITEIQNNPFDFVQNRFDLNRLLSYISLQGFVAKACFYTDKSAVPFCQPLKIFPNTKFNYSLIVPPNGTVLKSVKIITPPEIEIQLSKVEIKPLSFSELVSRNYVPNFKER